MHRRAWNNRFGPVVVGGDRSNAPTRRAATNFLNSDAASEDVPIVEHATTVDPHPHPSLGSRSDPKAVHTDHAWRAARVDRPGNWRGANADTYEPRAPPVLTPAWLL